MATRLALLNSNDVMGWTDTDPPSGSASINVVRTASGILAIGPNADGSSPIVTIQTTVSGGSGTSNFFSISGTLQTTNTVAAIGIRISITSAGSSSFSQTGLTLSLASGYTGSSFTVGMSFTNSAASTGTGVVTGTGNSGINGIANGTTTGTNLAGWFSALNGAINSALLARAITAKNSGTNVGITSVALNTGSSPTQVAGYFGLHSADPTYASCALCADNGAQSSPVFLARVNGTTWHQVDANGNTIQGNGSALVTTATNGFIYASNCAGTPTGVPAALPTGSSPIVYDTTAHKIWVYDGAWKGVAVA